MAVVAASLSSIVVEARDFQEQQQVKQLLVGDNPQRLKGYEINHMDWVPKPKPGQARSMVNSFLSKTGANAVLAVGVLAWEGGIKRTVRYSRACGVLQCFKCYEYGYTTRRCRNTE